MEVMRQNLTCVRHEVDILYNLSSLFLFNKAATNVVEVTALVSTGGTHSNLRMGNRLTGLSFLVFVPRPCRMGSSIRPLPFPDHF